MLFTSHVVLVTTKWNGRFILKGSILLVWLVCAAPFGLAAQDESQAKQPKIFTQSLNTYPYGPILGFYALNYELLISQRHGFVLEGIYIDYRAAIFKPSNPGIGGRINTQYRWHLSKAMESFFIGVFLRYYNFTYATTEYVITNGNGANVGFDMTITSYGAGLNIGWRWVGDSGVNAAVRIGYGPSVASVTATRSEQSILQRAADLKDKEVLYGGFDVEASIGYAF